MNAEQRAEIRARLEKATPGPWEFSDSSDPRGDKGEFRAPNPHNGFMLVGPWTNSHDADFIAHSRQDIELLLDALDVAEGKIERAAKELNVGFELDVERYATDDAIALALAILQGET